MTLRSSTFLRTQLLLRRQEERQRIEALGREPTIDGEPFDFYARRRGLQRIAVLQRDLARVGPELDVSIEGPGVYRDSASFRRLTVLMDPLGQALRYTARDIFRVYGEELVPGVALDELAEPVFAGSFANGSFGIHVSRSPVGEQPTLFNDVPLFDRSVDTFLDVFRAARDEADPAPIIESVAGLRTFAVSGYKKLANVLSLSSSTTTLRWHSDEIIAVTPAIADMVDEALSTVSTHEETIRVIGTLTGSDMNDERFHVIVREPDRDRHYRGGVEADALAALKEITPDTRVRAEIVVHFTESDLLNKPRESYDLRSVTVLDG